MNKVKRIDENVPTVINSLVSCLLKTIIQYMKINTLRIGFVIDAVQYLMDLKNWGLANPPWGGGGKC